MSTMKILCKRVMPFHLLFLPSFIIPHRYTSMDLTTAMVSLAMEESRVVRILSVKDVSTEITLEQGGSSKYSISTISIDPPLGSGASAVTFNPQTSTYPTHSSLMVSEGPGANTCTTMFDSLKCHNPGDLPNSAPLNFQVSNATTAISLNLQGKCGGVLVGNVHGPSVAVTLSASTA
ncbi:hypothetical protein RJ641_009846 [Dillenia turbinata]|uniref:Uncharacterized protein n=1 Tax=Dillenia turbinata TaxID=194707 RepID=A0AAN8V4X2_9MAGN